MFRKIIALVISLSFILQQACFAQTVPVLPGGVTAAAPQPADVFRPLHLRYLSCEGEQLKLIFDRGSNPGVQGMEAEAGKLVEYFLTGLSLPNDVFWVNLRPDSSANIIDDRLARTDLGKVFLEADVQLKKDVALATSPSTPEGRLYWDKLYKKAGELYGAGADIPTVVRPWIVPGEVIMAESANGAYIYKATLKVMLEQDYLASTGKELADYTFADSRRKELNAYSAQLMREMIIPVVTREVNSARKYASLRQAFYSLIFAQWFKQKASVNTGSYGRRVDSGDLTGIASARPWDRMSYYEAYRASFRDGEYNVRQTEGSSVRTYVSGGLQLTGVSPVVLAQSADPGQLIAAGSYLEQARTDFAGGIEFAAWGASARPEALTRGMKPGEFYAAVSGADSGLSMRDGGRKATLAITGLIVAASIIMAIFHNPFSPSSQVPVTPSAQYSITTPTPSPSATSRAVVLTPEKGAAAEALSVMLDGEIYRFSPQMEGLEAVLEYAGFPGGKMAFSYTSACIISEGEYLDLRDMDSDYLELARQMLDRVNTIMTSGISLSQPQRTALEKLQEALTFSVNASSEAQRPEGYVGFRVDISKTAYYVVMESPTFYYLQANGDATKRYILNKSNGSLMIGGRLYHPGETGYADAAADMLSQANKASKGSYRDDGWRIPAVKDQKALLQSLAGVLKDYQSQKPAASPTPSASAPAATATTPPQTKPTEPPSPTVTQGSGDVPPGATDGSFFTIKVGGAEYKAWMEQGDMEIWVENANLPGGKMAVAYDPGAIVTAQKQYIDLRAAEYAAQAGKLLDAVNSMLNSGKLNQKQTEMLTKVQRHLKYYLDINAEAQKVDSMVGFRVDLSGSGYYILESTSKYAWLHNDETGVKLIYNWANGDILVGGKIYSPGDKLYPADRAAAVADLTGKAKQMQGGTFRTDGYRIDVPGQKDLLNKLIADIQKRDGGALEPGGIDLTAIPFQFRADTDGFLARMGALTVSFEDTVRERRNIARMVSGGMVPSEERVQEFFAACYQKGELRRFSGDMLAWTALILRQQEEGASDTQPAVRQMLTVVQNI